MGACAAAESRKTPGISASTAQILDGGLLEEGGLSQAACNRFSAATKISRAHTMVEFPGEGALPSRQMTTKENSPFRALSQQSEGFEMSRGFIGFKAETLVETMAK